MPPADDARQVLPHERVATSVFEQGLGLFGSAEDAALLDEIVAIAYNERRRPSKPMPTR
jgi:hypothetical protein